MIYRLKEQLPPEVVAHQVQVASDMLAVQCGLQKDLELAMLADSLTTAELYNMSGEIRRVLDTREQEALTILGNPGGSPDRYQEILHNRKL